MKKTKASVRKSCMVFKWDRLSREISDFCLCRVARWEHLFIYYVWFEQKWRLKRSLGHTPSVRDTSKSLAHQDVIPETHDLPLAN